MIAAQVSSNGHSQSRASANMQNGDIVKNNNNDNNNNTNKTHYDQQNNKEQDAKAHMAFSKEDLTFPSCEDLNASKVAKFYAGKNVLITGGSGFLGKVLIWKLLETCKGINKIYVLIRSKGNLTAEKRLVQLLKGKPFCFKYDSTDLLKKVAAIESDMTIAGLGLSEEDRVNLQEQVNIVFHSAASVKFDAPLKENLRDNVYGTRSIVDLCNGMKNLNALVHVSTAYSNCQSRDIAEELQPLKMDVDDVVKIVDSLADDACDLVTEKLLEGRPNTYTYTKAIAEHFVAKQEGKYPITIVRPSIVISSALEPIPGWVDNVNGIAGLGCLAAVGMLRTIDWNYYATSDMVPVDYVANCLIVAAHEIYEKSPRKLRIYNMTSGNMNPVSWGAFFDMLRKTAVKTPPNKIVRPMISAPRYNRANPTKFFLIRFFSELLFAHTIDMLLTLIGYKKVLVKITQKMHHGYKILMPFTTNEWNFKSDNVISMSDSMNRADKNLFKFDMRDFDWESQAEVVWKGARNLLLKEDSSEQSYKTARGRQMLVTLVHYSFIVTFFAAAFAVASYPIARVLEAF